VTAGIPSWIRTHLGLYRIGDPVRAEQFAAVEVPAVERVDGGDGLLPHVGRERLPQLLVAVDDEHVLHGRLLLLVASFHLQVGAGDRFSTSPGTSP
jgi:hypothetical protein